MGLPTLVFGSEIEGAGVLQVRRQDNGLVPSFARKLDTKVPGVECDESKLQILGYDVFLGKLIESIDSISEGAGVPYVFPGERSEAGCRRSVSESKETWRSGCFLLQRGVMGVLTGLTKTLSR